MASCTLPPLMASALTPGRTCLLLFVTALGACSSNGGTVAASATNGGAGGSSASSGSADGIAGSSARAGGSNTGGTFGAAAGATSGVGGSGGRAVGGSGTGGMLATTGGGAGSGGAFGGTAGAASGPWEYTNPVISGDWSDPAVTRVGDDYYSVRSTMGWQPALELAHSRDLVHWEYLGHVADSLNIATGETDFGVWGSELIFNPNTQKFLVYSTFNGISVFEASDPKGPWKDVSGQVTVDGYDPGAFVDTDGKVYLVTSAGKIAQLSADGHQLLNASVSVFKSDGGFCEGPELFKHGDYYYVTWSEGGTDRGADGTIMSARSKTLAGPWERDPTNPIMENLNRGTDPQHPFEGPQHSEPLETQNGEWFVTVHTWQWNYGTLAREMCLEPLTWTADGWWRPKNGKKPSLTNTAPNLPRTDLSPARSDDFSASTLGNQWFFHTKPDWSGKSWSLSARPGYLRLFTQPGTVHDASAYKAIVLERIDLKAFTITTALDFDAKSNGESAGLILHSTLGANVTLSLTRGSSGKNVELAYELNAASHADGSGAQRTVVATAPFSGTSAQLKATFDGHEQVGFAFSTDGTNWQNIGKSVGVGLNQAADLSWRVGSWTGATAGLFAIKNGATTDNQADFDSFVVTPAP